METIAGIFFENAKQNPDKEAVWCDGTSLTYAELSRKVRQYAGFLKDCHVQYGEHIGFPMNNSMESVVLIMAAAAMGVGLVPMNPTQPPAAMKPSFEIGDVKHLIARKAFLDQLEESDTRLVKGSVICMDAHYEGTRSLLDADNYKEYFPDLSRITGKETFFLTMTSGSTGYPKPIHLTQENKYMRAMAHIEMYKLTESDRVLAATPLYHSLAERLVLMPLILGATAILMPRFTPALWLDCIEDQAVTFSIAVSAQLTQVLRVMKEKGIEKTGHLRCLVSSSALLEVRIKEELIHKLQCEFHEMYGTSETSTVTDICFSKTPDKYQSVGRAIKEATVRILDKENKPAPFGEIGEIACRSSLVCKGYYNREEWFREAMVDGYFRTGDLGYLDEEGFLYFSGRKKDVIITGAVNVYPQDVEAVVNQMDEVDESAAFSYPDVRLGEIVALAVVVKPQHELKKRAVQIQCAKHLADFQQPHQIFFVDRLPKNSMGKLMRGEIFNIVKGKEKDVLYTSYT